MSCLIPSLYDMTADLYLETSVQDRTGQFVRTWAFSKTIQCDVRGISQLRGKQTGTAQQWKNQFESYNFVRLKTSDLITDGMKITNVKDANGVCRWNEYTQESALMTPTIFGIVGVTPQYDPFGGFNVYAAFLDRSGVQSFA